MVDAKQCGWYTRHLDAGRCRFIDHELTHWDRVHPNYIGHMVLAREFLQAVGFQW
jgi:hypothetical protein